jgi:hypothetical protein
MCKIENINILKEVLKPICKTSIFEFDERHFEITHNPIYGLPICHEVKKNGFIVLSNIGGVTMIRKI